MPSMPVGVSTLVEFTRQNLMAKEYPHDRIFNEKRQELQTLCNNYAKNPAQSGFP